MRQATEKDREQWTVDKADRQTRRDQRELDKYAEWRKLWDKTAEEKEVD